jgi:hypothetical protein
VRGRPLWAPRAAGRRRQRLRQLPHLGASAPGKRRRGAAARPDAAAPATRQLPRWPADRAADRAPKTTRAESGLQPFELHHNAAEADLDYQIINQRAKEAKLEHEDGEQPHRVDGKKKHKRPAKEHKPTAKPSPSPSPSPAPAPASTLVAVDTQQGRKAADKFTPTREMVQRIAQDGYLVVTWANYHYLGFTLSWVEHVKAVGVTGYTVGAMDDQILQELDHRKINTFSMKSGLTLGDFGWGSKTFAKMGRQKIRLVELFLELGAQVGARGARRAGGWCWCRCRCRARRGWALGWSRGGAGAAGWRAAARRSAGGWGRRQGSATAARAPAHRHPSLPSFPFPRQVIIADVDVVWLRNPIPYFQRYPDADVLTSSDHLAATVKDEGLELWPQAASAANIGIMLFRWAAGGAGAGAGAGAAGVLLVCCWARGCCGAAHQPHTHTSTPREKSIPFVKEWIDLIEKDETVWDQNAFNDLFRRGVKVRGPQGQPAAPAQRT